MDAKVIPGLLLAQVCALPVLHQRQPAHNRINQPHTASNNQVAALTQVISHEVEDSDEEEDCCATFVLEDAVKLLSRMPTPDSEVRKPAHRQQALLKIAHISGEVVLASRA
jgi:hypothetical protein